MAIIVIENADKNAVEQFRSIAQVQGVSMTVIDETKKQSPNQLALYDALDTMPIIDGYDDEDIQMTGVRYINPFTD